MQRPEAGLPHASSRAANYLSFPNLLKEMFGARISGRDTAELAQLGDALRRLHSMPLIGHTFDATTAAKQYAQQARGIDRSVVSLCLDLIAGIRTPHNLCCSHNDLVVENIISTPGIRFLDWEYACDNDPFFDLATLVVHNQLDDERTIVVLDAYFDGGGEQWLDYLEKYRGLYLALLCLWMAAQTDYDSDQLEAVVDRVVTNYS